MTYCRIMAACLLALSLIIGVVHASAPHPRVRQMIKEGIIPEPYYLKHLHELRSRGINAPWAAPELRLQRSMEAFPSTRSLGPALVPQSPFNALVILVDFSDDTSQVQSTEFDTLIFVDTSGTVRDYYQAVSYGNLDIVAVDLPSAVGWIRAPQTYAYYVNSENGLGINSYPNNAQKLVEDAVRAVDDSVDFSQYDNDRDGYVDALFVVHAGPGAEFTGNDNDVWSHAWVTADSTDKWGRVSLDGVYVWRYSMEPEYWETPGDMTIGVYAHELGHALFSLPDLYDRDDPDGPSASSGLDRWSLMAAGSWNGSQDMGSSPACPDAWCRTQMGYVQPVNVTADSIDQTIVSIETTPDIYRLWTDGVLSEEYFLVENRQKIGYDTYLPGSGLLIYHVDEQQLLPYDDPPQNDNEWYPGHTSYDHYLVALEQADGLYDLEQDRYSDAGDPFPGLMQNTAFYDFGRPNSQAYNGEVTKIAVTNISSSAAVMTADFRLLQPVAPPTIQAIYDFPGDQGGRVVMEWSPSPDESHELHPVDTYGIWTNAPVDTPTQGLPTVLIGDTEWMLLDTVHARSDTLYHREVPTFVDSNHTGLNLSYFRISAQPADSLLTSFSVSASGYSMDNLVPTTPTNLSSVIVGADSVRLTWEPSPDSDLQGYRVYRGQSQDFLPTQANLYHAATTDTFFHDTGLQPGDRFYYRVAAVDINGNVSEYTAAVTPGVVALAEQDRGLPTSLALHPNYPNPFNPITTLRFDLPRLTRVSIIVFDLRGREVVRLVDELMEPGYHQVVWNGRGRSRRDMPTGIYIARLHCRYAGQARLVTPGFTKSIKMVLLK